MATVVSNGTGGGSWSSGSTWVGGNLPQDNDLVEISAGDSVLMDVDTSGWATGVNTVTIRGSNSGTPGMLYFKNGTNGHLKIRTGNGILGDGSTNRGRLLANANGVWGNTTPLQASNTAVIQLLGAGSILVGGLDVALHATHPTNKYVDVFYNNQADSGNYFEFDAATAVDIVNNTITLPYDPPANATMVTFKPIGSALLPGGLQEDIGYYIYARDTGTNTCKLTYAGNMVSTLVDITSVGSGTVAVIATFTTSHITQTFSVFQDISSDTAWKTDSGFNRVILVNSHSNSSYDQQRGTISAINNGTPDTIQISFTNSGNNLDSAQTAGGKLFLVSRNVSIRSECTLSTSPILSYQNSSPVTSIFDCEIVNTYAFGLTTQNSFYGYCFHAAGSTVPIQISGTIAGFESAVNSCAATSLTMSGVIVGCKNGFKSCTTTCTFSCTGYICGTENAFNDCDSAWSYSGTSHSCSYMVTGCDGNYNLSGKMLGVSYGVFGGGGSPTISGLINSCLYGISSMTTGVPVISATIIDGTSGGIINCSAPFYFSGTIRACSPGNISNCSGAFIMNGLLANALTGITFSNSGNGEFTVGGTITSVTTAIAGTVNKFILSGCTISNCTTAVAGQMGFEAYNLTLSGNSTDMDIPSTLFGYRSSAHSYNHNGVEHDLRAWSRGGSMTHEVSIVPAGKSYSHKFTYTNSMHPALMEWPIYKSSGDVIVVDVYAKHADTSLSEAQRIHWALVDLSLDPLVDPENSYLDSFIAIDSTDWQTHTLKYYRSDIDKPIVLRCWAYRASGNAYVYCEPQRHRFPLPSMAP